jgi:lipopolysaccharide export system permease protein
MLLFHRYLLRQFLIALVFTCTVVTIVALFTQSFRLLSMVINNAAGVWAFLQLASLLIPTFLNVVLPIGLAIAIIFVFQKLAGDSELVVMRAAGLSPLSLARPALWLGAVAVACGLVLAFWVSPWANRTFVKLQYDIRNEFSVYAVRPGVFNDVGKGLTFYARRRDSKGGLEGLLIHDARKPDMPVTIMADRGMLTMVEDAPRIVVFSGQRQEFDRVNNRITTLDFTQYAFDLGLLKGSNDRLPDPRELSLEDLLADEPVAIKRGNGVDRLRAELHQRIAGGLSGLAFAVLAAAIMLGGEFSRRGMATRVIAAALTIVVYQAALMWLNNLAAKNLTFVPALYALVLLPLPLSWLLLRYNPLAQRGITPNSVAAR